MSAEAISKNIFIREFTQALHDKNAAVLAGAGLSVGAGYVDWKGLLREIIEDLKLNPNDEDDLVALAQYHCNESAGNRSALTKKIFDYFSATKLPTDNHRILSNLPIHTYWTTNYDRLIETALVDVKKIPDTKYTVKQLSSTKFDRDVVVYKMHGDVEHSADAVITREDYEEYPLKMAEFIAALRGDLIEKTFLFIGFSFTDPNLDYVLSRVRVRYGTNQRRHYCIQKLVSKEHCEDDAQFNYRVLKQHYFIKDLKRYGIQTVLVNEYREITELLREISDRYKRRSIFISGSAHDFGRFSGGLAEDFLHKLSYKLLDLNNKVVTGFGLGVGSPVINGALACLNDKGKTISEEDIVMRPFPQSASGPVSLPVQWTGYRQAMLDHAGIVIFVFGNKVDASGNVVLANGMKEEFEIAIKSGLKPLPVGSTGFMAKELWDDVLSKFSTYYPGASADFLDNFKALGDTNKTGCEIIDILANMIANLQRS